MEVEPLYQAIRLRVVGGGHLVADLQGPVELPPQGTGELCTPIQHDMIEDTETADPGPCEGSAAGGCCSGVPVNDGEQVLVALGRWEGDNEVAT